jgi:Rab-GTPase-TBC domain
LSFFLEPYNNLGRRRYAALERILFLWSKFNQGVRYVQGMNEIVGILYYVMANDANEQWAEWAEADTYWLFHGLLMEMSDVFVAGLDDQETGLQGRIQAMQHLLARHDPEVREHLDELGIETSFYAIRWWTTLLSREFLMPDVIRLWDSMFASTHKDNFLRFACVTMVMKIRDSLLKSDFATCLRLLHSYPSTNMDELLESSRALYIYESQVTLACHRGGLSLHQALTSIRSPRALIMAFGFSGGTPPVTRAEQLERAKSSVEAGVRGVFGRASKLYNTWYQTDQKKELANDKALALGRKGDDDDDGTNNNRSRSFDSAEDVYLNAFRSE